jgi:hypothetical protein
VLCAKKTSEVNRASVKKEKISVQLNGLKSMGGDDYPGGRRMGSTGIAEPAGSKVLEYWLKFLSKTWDKLQEFGQRCQLAAYFFF